MPVEDDSRFHQTLLVPEKERTALENEAAALPHITLGARQLCHIELLLNGGFAPLSGYSSRKDYDCVLESMRLGNGALWSIPIALDVPENLAKSIEKRPRLVMRDAAGTPLVVLDVEDV